MTTGPHHLPPLPYPYNGLEPYISEQIMTLHHTKHHQGYVLALNAAEANYIKAVSAKERIALQATIKFNGGGHINHSLFWTNLVPAAAKLHGGGSGGVLNAGPLRTAIEARWGTFEDFKREFNRVAAAIEGAGWGWLGYNARNKLLEIVTTPNQDPLLTHVPIIAIDVWEHAFYLQYLHKKDEYLARIWNVINFQEAERRFKEAVEGRK